MLTQEQKDEIMQTVSNRRKHDKYSLSYILDCMTFRNYGLSLDGYKRDALLSIFKESLNNETYVARLVRLNGFKQYA